MKNILMATAIVMISLSAAAASKQKREEFQVRPGMTMKCPIQVLVVDKETGLKGADGATDPEERGYFIGELKLDENLSATQNTPLKDGRSIEIELRKDENLNLFGLSAYIIDPTARPQATSYMETLLKFEKVSTGGGWDGEAGSGKYTFIKGSLEPRTGYYTIDYRIRKKLVEAKLIPTYMDDYELDPNTLMNFMEPLKKAVALNLLKDGQVIGLGTVFSCNLK